MKKARTGWRHFCRQSWVHVDERQTTYGGRGNGEFLDDLGPAPVSGHGCVVYRKLERVTGQIGQAWAERDDFTSS